jgi:hypothetical protein
MSKITNKMKYLINTKNMIRNSIAKKGIEITDEDSFRSYADKIDLLNESFGGKYNIIQKSYEDGTCDLIISDAISITDGFGSGEYVCKLIDYDGTILKEEHLNAGDIFLLPKLPKHKGLIAQGYSSAVDIIDNQILVTNSDITVGVMYTTESGLSEFDIELNKLTGLDVRLNMDGNKDWGDGTTNTEYTHTYDSYGEYTIKCDGVGIAITYGFFGQGAGSSTGSGTENYYCKNIRLSSNVTRMEVSACEFCNNLKTITMPNTITEIGNRAFNGCKTLKSLVIPNGVTIMGDYVASECFGLQYIVIPKGINSIGSRLCYNDYSLKNIVIPNSVSIIGLMTCYMCNSLESASVSSEITNLPTSMFQNCYSLTKLLLPNNVSVVNGGVFNGASSILVFDFSKNTIIPTLSYASGFTNINALAKIIVPDNLYNEWIISQNWSGYADYIYKASEVL